MPVEIRFDTVSPRSPRLVAVLLRFGPVVSWFNTVCAGSARYRYGLHAIRFNQLCLCVSRNRMNYLIKSSATDQQVTKKESSISEDGLGSTMVSKET